MKSYQRACVGVVLFALLECLVLSAQQTHQSFGAFIKSSLSARKSYLEIEEAALLDNASRWKILWRIMVPLARPAIATLATFGFLYAWNSFFWPLVIINSGNPDGRVLSLALSTLGGRSSTDLNLVFAGAMVAMAPPILVFLFAQRYFVENSASSGLK